MIKNLTKCNRRIIHRGPPNKRDINKGIRFITSVKEIFKPSRNMTGSN